MLPGLTPLGLMGSKPFDAPGSQSFTTPGSYDFDVPNYATSIIFTLYGSGSGGKSDSGDQYSGSPATITLLSLIAEGGSSSSGGTATGGDTNINGNSASGNNGGTGIDGIGAGGQGCIVGKTVYPGGGSGSKLIKTFLIGVLVPGTTLTLVVPAGGVRAIDSVGQTTAGAAGRINVSWS